MEASAAESTPSRLPVTVVTGLLGSGKTTLLSSLLRAHRDPQSPRLLVIQNEFSEKMQIEAPALIEAASAFSSERESETSGAASLEVSGSVSAGGSSLKLSASREASPLPDVIELPNGCLCCVVRSELLSALENIASLLEERREQVDAVVLEVNGVSDPEKIIQALWVDEQLQSRLRLDGVVATVDASSPPQALLGVASLEEEGSRRASLATDPSLGETALRQVALADRVLLTKTDTCVDEAQKKRLTLLRRRVQDLNPTALVSLCVRGSVDPAFVLRLHAYDSSSQEDSRTAGRETSWIDTLARVQHSLASDSLPCKHVSHRGKDSAVCIPGERDSDALQSVFIELSVGDVKQEGPSGSEQNIRRLLSVQLLQRQVAAILWGEDDGTCGTCYRCKGLFAAWRDCLVEGDEQKGFDGVPPWGSYLLQGVSTIFEIRRPPKTSLAEAQVANALGEGGSGELKAKFLFVGKGLNRQAITERLQACITTKPQELAG